MNNNRIRTIGIIIAAILGLAALLYLGGLVCQLLTEYQIWLTSGGMQGDTRIGDIRLAPLSCWRQALTLSGLKYTGLVALIGGSAYTLVRLYDRFGSRDFDDRNFSRSQRGTYGTAGWMGERELRTVLEVASPQKARGIILGQNDRGSVICLPEDTRLNKRLGAEVDYVIKGIDQASGIVAASRLEAMAMKRREYYFRTDRDGNYQIYAGICAEARVVSVIRAGIFVELFGAECYIPLRELSYQRWLDATAHYQPGQRVLVKVLEVERSDRSRLRVSASVKQAGENPYEKALKKYAVGSLYVGTVSMVDTTGVFVSLDGGIDCLCTYPKRGRPPRGCRVSVRILGINYESNRIWGVITHMSTVR